MVFEQETVTFPFVGIEASLMFPSLKALPWARTCVFALASLPVLLALLDATFALLSVHDFEVKA